MSGRYPFERRRVIHAKEIMLDESTALRVPLSEDERFQLVALWYPEYRSQADLYPEIASIAQRYESAKQIVKSYVNPAVTQMFGSPVYQEDGGHLQTVGQELSRVLVQAGDHTAKQLIDKCVRLLIEMWRCGVSDSVFNLTASMQILNDETVIMADFYEITQDLGAVETMLSEQKWRQNRMLASHIHGELAEYVALQFSRNLTVENLRKEWRRHYR